MKKLALILFIFPPIAFSNPLTIKRFILLPKDGSRLVIAQAQGNSSVLAMAGLDCELSRKDLKKIIERRFRARSASRLSSLKEYHN